jgi:hypothetical protein
MSLPPRDIMMTSSDWETNVKQSNSSAKQTTLKKAHSPSTQFKWPPHCDVGLDKGVLRKQTAGNSDNAFSKSGAF